MAQRFEPISDLRSAMPSDEILDHFTSKIREALDAKEYDEAARLARCASAYQRTLYRFR